MSLAPGAAKLIAAPQNAWDCSTIRRLEIFELKQKTQIYCLGMPLLRSTATVGMPIYLSFNGSTVEEVKKKRAFGAARLPPLGREATGWCPPGSCPHKAVLFHPPILGKRIGSLTYETESHILFYKSPQVSGCGIHYTQGIPRKMS
jgi:hypothetical protein